MALLSTVGKTVRQKAANSGKKLKQINAAKSGGQTPPPSTGAPSPPTGTSPPTSMPHKPRKGIYALAVAGGIGAGIGSTDPMKAGIAKFEESVMGDPNFSRSILGDQMGPGALFGISNAQAGYMGKNLYNSGVRYRNTRSSMRDIAPGEMVFGMFNSRMQ